MDEDWLEFHPNPKKPDSPPPSGAVDAHCHVFGPAAEFPFAPERKYTPCDASKNELWALRHHLRFSRNVIVQATCHGTDNRALVDALNQSSGHARGVAAVWPHPNMKSHIPDGGQLVDIIPVIAPTAELQQALLVDSPTRLYWEDS